MERAEAIMTAMEEQGLEATLGLYNMLMDGYVHCRAVDKCLNVFRRLKARTIILCVSSTTGTTEIGKLVHKYCSLSY